MKMTQIKKMLSFILCMVLIAAMALIAVGCNDKEEKGSSNGKSETVSISNSDVSMLDDDGFVKLGEGSVEFDFIVVDIDDKETKFKISTDKKTVGEALMDVSLIAGEDSQYGLYVKTVNGQTLDYDTDGKYWAFYVNGEYATSGVDTTEIKAGETYSFKAE